MVIGISALATRPSELLAEPVAGYLRRPRNGMRKSHENRNQHFPLKRTAVGVGRQLEYMLTYWNQMFDPEEEVHAYLRKPFWPKLSRI
jgi:hypothetical protein